MKDLQFLHGDTQVDRLNQISNQIQVPSPTTWHELLVPESVEGESAGCSSGGKKQGRFLLRSKLEKMWNSPTCVVYLMVFTLLFLDI